MTPRKLAYDLLLKAERTRQYSNITLDNALKGEAMSDADKRLASILFYGVTERRITLDYRISALSDRALSELDPAVLTAIRLGLYQLIYLDRIPPHAAIKETVDLVSRKSSGFVNAILRAHTRAPELSLPPIGEHDSYLSVKYSVGLPLVRRLISIFGEGAEDILCGFDHIPDLTLRVNTLKVSREALSDHLHDSQFTKNASTGLHTHGSVREMYGFDDGLFFVQDEASQICVEVLAPNAGDTVLDICSCPGSKSFGAAITMNNKGKIKAFDLHENKLSLIRSGAQRLGIDIIETCAHDGRVPIDELIGSADKVLCDVPCSGFGVLAKKPELRYKDPAESDGLPNIQLDILNNACRYLRVGGVLVYSTCTVLPAENEENIKRFLDTHTDFELVPWSVGAISAPVGMLTLYPHIHMTDGFFIAKLVRKQ